MNNELFQQEIVTYIQDCYEEFIKYQDIVLKIFDAFVEICNRHKIKYYAAYGTLLGAVRDKNTIPWDYDMDLWVSVSDRKFLLQVLEEELPAEYYCAYSSTILDYPANCLRVCEKGLPFTAVHLDIFFLIGFPENEKEQKRFKKRVDFLSELRTQKYGLHWFPHKATSKLKKIIDGYIALKGCLFTDKWLLKQEEKIMYQYPVETSKYVYVADVSPNRPVYETKWFGVGKIQKFGKRTIYIPTGYESILANIYGGNLGYLPIKLRFNEFYDLYGIIQERTSQKLIDTKKQSVLLSGK